MTEFELINRYFNRAAECSSVVLGVGDDCSLLQLPEQRQLAISVDTLVADVHFPANADPASIAERALCVSLSDLAAMGAEPLWFTLCLTLPEASEPWVSAFSRGLFRVASEYRCELVGGDTTRGPLAISIQVMGAVSPDCAFTRGGAQVGDLVYVTGTLGDGAAGLAGLKQMLKLDSKAFEYLSRRYYHPVPRFDAARKIVGLASAAIDISDGLVADLGHICRASEVAANIHLECLPLSPALLQWASLSQQHQWALGGGDDYQLCFTVSPSNVEAVETLIDRGLDACVIGDIVSGSDVHPYLRGERFSSSSTGYQHFG